MVVASPDSLNDEDAYIAPSAHALSLLSARRPSLAGPVDSLTSYVSATRPNDDFFLSPPIQEEISTPIPDFSRDLQIKMQSWVGDGACKMSISPSGRDVVLAARSGLYIIDLEAPFEVPRFLPQGGTWDVADVQWNPHPFRANYVVSTSSEKLLIWNLDRPDREAIQFILPRHYRSITDLNWHNHNPDIVASTSIDSWIWLWDLRTPAKPVTGLCAFNPGATQVKWNRHNENILASSHGNVLLIWDQRKGAVPLTRIKAHTARIYGIDWSRQDEHEVVSCSLDGHIKFWNASTSVNGAGDAIPRPLTDSPTHTPRQCIETKYPVWRARHVPFGTGVLSLPLRGIQRPKLFCKDHPINIIPETITDDGQPDIVKEYVWRTKGGLDKGYDDREFQLVTWSEDRTLRTWTIDESLLEESGFLRGSRINDASHHPTSKYISYRALSTNVSDMPSSTSIAGGIRVGRATRSDNQLFDQEKPAILMESIRRGGTMTKGTSRSKRSGMHALTWMPSVTVGEKKEGSIPMSLESSFTSMEPQRKTSFTKVQGSQSPRALVGADNIESETSPYWVEELTTVVNGLSSMKKVKILLERSNNLIGSDRKVDIPKRSCTIGFQGPWGESSSSVFTRVTFAFPRDYPRLASPESLPSIDLEKNHLIPTKRRAFALRQLNILRKRLPCLESCLKFLLGLPNRVDITGKVVDTDSGSSSEGENIAAKPTKDGSLTSRGQIGLAEPRTSQGVFGPNGEMVFFSHLALRMVRNMGQSPSRSAPTPSREGSELNQPSGMLSDALRRLTAVAHDRSSTPSIATGADEDLIRTLESLAQHKTHFLPESSQSGDVRDSTVLVRPVRKSRVTIRDVSDITGIDKLVAQEYIFAANDVSTFCSSNAGIARTFGRVDHERIFSTLNALLGVTKRTGNTQTFDWKSNELSRNIILSMLQELADKKDIVMLAMMSVALFASEKDVNETSSRGSSKKSPNSSRKSFKIPHHDYFNPGERQSQTRLRASSTFSHISQSSSIPSPVTPGPSASLNSTSSSRSSWSSLANGVRFFVGAQEGSVTPKPQNSPLERTRTLPLIGEESSHVDSSPKGKTAVEKRNSPPTVSFATQKTWSEPTPASLSQTQPTRLSVSFTSLGYADGHEANSPWPYIAPKRLSIQIHGYPEESNIPGSNLYANLSEYVIALGEFLFRWQLYQKRAELLQCLPEIFSSRARTHDAEQRLVVLPLCQQCGVEMLRSSDLPCQICRVQSQKPCCSVCRLPVIGLAHICLICCHTTHVRCWQGHNVKACPTGCGCDCSGRGAFESDATDPLGSFTSISSPV